MANTYSTINQLLSGIASAIRTKTGDSSPIVADNFPSIISSLPTGGSSSVSKSDVNFYDHDGTILHSYTKAEALALTELPSLPTRSGFTCQGWNYTLAQLKTEVNDHDKCDIGAIYITDDGKTRIKIRLESKFYSNIPLYFNQTDSNGVTIDWGDGSDSETISTSGNVNKSHQYSPVSYPTEYTITINCTLGTMSFYTNIFGKTGTESTSNIIKVWTSMIKEVNIGYKVTSIGSNAFQNCHLLRSVNIPSSVTSIESNAFYYCNSLQSITIPSSITSIESGTFITCYSLQSITIPSSVNSIGSNAFQNCKLLQSITIPSSVTSIGSTAFGSCYSLQSINIPSLVTSIGDNAFKDCQSLQPINIPSLVTSIGSCVFQGCLFQSITIPSSVNSIGSTAFSGCYSLQSIIIPSSVTSIGGSAFSYCTSLHSIIIPSSVTSIGGGAFDNCKSLQSIIIPSSVTSIGSQTFNNCYGLKVFDFSSHTSIPTLSNVNAFQKTPTTKYIVVPDDLYETWITASNWSSSTNQIKASIIKKSDFDLL